MDNALKLLGLIYRAKKLILGEEVLESMRSCKLVIMASDISSKSRTRLLKKCAYYNVDYLECFTGKELSNTLGKNNIKVIGITDEGFKKSLIEKL